MKWLILGLILLGIAVALLILRPDGLARQALILLLVLVSIVAALEIIHKLMRSVTRLYEAEEILNFAVKPWMLRGWDGTRAVVFHQPSGLMVQAVKRLRPPRSLKGKVSVHVLKTRVANADAFDLKRGREVQVRGHPCRRIAFRRLPSPYKAHVLQDVDCGASLRRCEQVFAGMISEALDVSPRPIFYVWCEQGITSYVLGDFESS